MLELIKSFTFTIEFFDWLIIEGFNSKNLLERVMSNIYERVGEYYIHHTRVFSYGGKLDLTRIR